MDRSITGIVAIIESGVKFAKHGNYITLQSHDGGVRERCFVPDFTPSGEHQRGLSYEAHLGGWPVYVEDGVLRRAEG